jgi:hypothetical protein
MLHDGAASQAASPARIRCSEPGERPAGPGRADGSRPVKQAPARDAHEAAEAGEAFTGA